jgi:hypothetical protein
LFAWHQVECEQHTLESHEECSQDAKLDDTGIAEMSEQSREQARCKLSVAVPQHEQFSEVQDCELGVGKESRPGLQGVIELFLSESGVARRGRRWVSDLPWRMDQSSWRLRRVS